ncbi:BrnT family toxin [Pseudomonas fragi]|uniref:BrnT family toxin n=1 Tax=Pseudomonas fragi TaxID=296 RepID=A0A9Q6YEH4_PSEFR|nr:BrnT family toxin [Pseudomonas fragi]QPL32018.1 BrnT family toxin [Pseudomonas fragi]
MRITYDITKRNKTLLERGLDFADAKTVFSGHHLTAEDSCQDYGEVRLISIGLLKERMVVLVWTPRGADRRIISMRKANEREQALYAHRLG